MAYYDDVKTIRIAYIGFVSVMGTVIIVMLLQVLYFQTRGDQRAAQEASAGPPPQLADMTAKQQTMLNRRDVIDRERGIVGVGITRAMDLVVTELASGKAPRDVVGPAGPVATAPAAEGASPDGAPAVDAGGEAAAGAQDDAKTDAARDGDQEDGDPIHNAQPPEKQDEDKS